MKRLLALIAVALAALVAQGALATLLRPPWCPDLALLVLIGIGLRWEGAPGGLLFAGWFGFATDLLSGSLLGQHALLDLFAFSGTVLAARQLNLRGAWPLGVFAVTVTFLYGLAMLAITGFFVGGAALHWSWVGAQLTHSAMCGLFAPAVSSAVGRAAGWVGEDDPANRPLGLDPRGRPAR